MRNEEGALHVCERSPRSTRRRLIRLQSEHGQGGHLAGESTRHALLTVRTAGEQPDSVRSVTADRQVETFHNRLRPVVIGERRR